jgi:hypothetical protein
VLPLLPWAPWVSSGHSEHSCNTVFSLWTSPSGEWLSCLCSEGFSDHQKHAVLFSGHKHPFLFTFWGWNCAYTTWQSTKGKSMKSDDSALLRTTHHYNLKP